VIVFGQNHVKVILTLNMRVKINFKLNSRCKINFTQKQLNISESILYMNQF